jgi:multidrug efflux system membrane fusion protein
MSEQRIENSLAGYTVPVRSQGAIRYVPGGLRTLWILLAVVLLGLLLWAVWPSQSAQTNANAMGMNGPVPVGVAMATTRDVNVTLDALGAVTPLATVTVKPQVSGTLKSINFKEGQSVRPGDVLVEIDPRPYQAALDQAKGQLARDQAQLDNSKVDLTRYQALWAQNAISQQILATQEATVRTNAGTVEADKAAVEAAQVNLGYCTITSPVAGVVGLRQVDVGNYVQVGVTTGIVVVTQMQPMSVLFALPEDNIEAVMQQVRSGTTLPVDAYDRSQTTRLASGTLSTVDNEVDPTTGTWKARALFDNSRNELFPSQFVNIRLRVNILRDQITVPSAAIQRGASGTFVFVVGSDNTVSMKNVTLGPTDGDNVDIANGLDAGQKVVVDGADRLHDGSSVLLPGAKGNSPATGTAAPAKGHWHHRHHHPNGEGGSGAGGGP